MYELFRRLKLKPALALEISIASLFASILALASPLFVIQVLNRYIAHGVDATLVTLTSGALLAVILEFIFRQVRIRLSRTVSEQADAEISLSGYGILVKSKAGALEQIPVGQRRQVISAAQKVETAYGAGNVAAVFDVPFSLLFIGVLYLLSPILSGLASIFIIIVYLSGRVGSRHHQKLTRQVIMESVASNTLLNTATEKIDTVRAFNSAGYLYRAWMTLLSRTLKLRKSAESVQSFISTLSQSLAALMSITIITVGATLVVGGSIDVGTMIGANILAARALMPITRFSQLGVVFASAAESLLLLKEFSTIPQEPNTGSTKPNYTGSIEFKDAAFAYPGVSTPLFETLNIAIKPNTIVSICGANGTGKTTLARLIAGVFEPTRGQILVDGLDLKQASLNWWRRQIAYLPQEPALLNTTILENLQVVNSEADEERISQAIQDAGLGRYLDESVDGLDAKVKDNGSNL
ncbi:MAG: ATP-binding cassette domain-containing protein, partial [Rhodospirillales bacterium]|nr:ATP-binding cassette domain-containing protein [Rhodospirillales bacterium]